MEKIIKKRVFIIFFAFMISFSVYIGQKNTTNEKREIGVNWKVKSNSEELKAICTRNSNLQAIFWFKSIAYFAFLV